MENSNGNSNRNFKKNTETTKIETSDFKDYQFQTTYYGNSVAKFTASKKRTYFPVVFIAGIAYIATQILKKGVFSFSTWLRVIPILMIFSIYYRKVRVRRQSILIFYGIGVQLETEYLFGRSCSFIETTKIISAIIYDKMTYMELSPCIGLIIKDEKSLVVPFSDFKIPTKKNIIIYNALKMI
ncbi:GPI-GlcNAc transferase complex PIG-H component family protein [Cryptosporidium meleagridis]|uniref:GPI-GlcNAc transferase complex PIG-H component family protein n=1 Tax=Cryptosporidium meleagridis TaxID=93969 RepID=A0A2P4YYZ5_9CRYT|nr:GPI-GlcNAc transferase complex PIG-H component family protein [Cryptosporidium meleagridis]